LCFKMRRRHDVIAQTKTARFGRVDNLAGQDQFARSFFADDARQQHRRHGWKHAEFYFRLSKTRTVRSDHDVAGRDEFTTAAERGAVYERDRGLRDLIELAKDRVK